MGERYISDGTWFDAGTEAFLITSFVPGVGLFEGLRNGQRDQETCPIEEFIVLGHHSE